MSEQYSDAFNPQARPAFVSTQWLDQGGVQGSAGRPIQIDNENDDNAGSRDCLLRLKEALSLVNHVFSCGGTIPIVQDQNQNQNQNQPEVATTAGYGFPSTSSPVVLRWDAEPTSTSTNTSTGKLTFPFPISPSHNMSSLLLAMTPATFGRGQLDVYDPTYRLALALSPSSFSTSFDPYSLGIIDTIAQALLPTVLDSSTHRCVRAELYKLNVYSAPGGLFKSHVDTPRSPSQFGSLVVCLPVEHEGGQLVVRHVGGKAVMYDWGKWNASAGKAVRWAAFYSDCEHEVMPVTAGHRVTLTYNLFAVRGAGRLADEWLTLDPTHSPLFQVFREVLGMKAFFVGGGKLGVYCYHSYPHTNPSEAPLPDALKGTDMILWQVFRALGLKATVRPVMKQEDMSWEEDWEADYSDDPEACRDGNHFVLGRRFASVYQTDAWEGRERSDLNEELERHFRGRHILPRDQVEWLNGPTDKQLQISYMTYGNNAELSTVYSSCAMIVDIPPGSERESFKG